MSRIGKMPVAIPAKVDVNIDGSDVAIKGPLGTISQRFKGVEVAVDDGAIRVTPRSNSRDDRALWGLARALLQNMVTGVSTGWERTLDINGVGYRADVQGSVLTLSLGYSHPVVFQLPDGVSAEMEKQTTIKLKGIDKQQVGQTAATIRAFRPPEPYKGKGVKYREEIIRRKAGKAAK